MTDPVQRGRGEAPANLLTWLDSQEFNELMYAYRTAPTTDQTRVIRAFDAVVAGVVAAASLPSAAGAPVCGGARIGPDAQGCGSLLRYEHTTNGIEYWRCPQCGNPHWWKIPAAAGGCPHQEAPVFTDYEIRCVLAPFAAGTFRDRVEQALRAAVTPALSGDAGPETAEASTA